VTATTTPVRVGVVGVGSMGQHHARVLASLQGAVLAGVHDVDVAQARAIASRHGIAAFDSVDALLGEVEAVIIAAPTTLHHEFSLRCLDRGLHVLVEKPITATASEAHDLHAQASKSGLVLQVGHIERFNPTFAEMKNVLLHERAHAFSALRLSPFTARAADVSVVLDLMIHDLDLVLALIAAPIASIAASGHRAKSSRLDHVTALMTFANGTTATLTASKIGQRKVREITVVCDSAFVEADLLHRAVRVHRASASSYLADQGMLSYKQEGVVENVLVPVVEPLHAQLVHFVECVRGRKQPLVTADVGRRVLEVALEIESLAERSISASA
jgi:predicted dehydrogenase